MGFNILRRRQSTKQSGDFSCQGLVFRNGMPDTCGSRRLKFVDSNGPVDTYRCKDCGQLNRYYTNPFDGTRVSPKDTGRVLYEGLHHKEMNRYVKLPGLGKYRVRRSG